MSDIDGELFYNEVCSACHEPTLHNKEAFEAGFECAKRAILKEICCGPFNTLQSRILNLKVEEKP